MSGSDTADSDGWMTRTRLTRTVAGQVTDWSHALMLARVSTLTVTRIGIARDRFRPVSDAEW